MSDFKTTTKGTKLPLLKLKGKDYLQVAHRLVWFREENPTGIIKTQLLHHQDNTAIFKAEIYVNNQLVSSAHKTESSDNFSDYIEKAETGAIGRALAMAGYGTQFEPEFDEGMRLADAPIDPVVKGSATLTNNAQEVTNSEPKVMRPTFKKKVNKSEVSEDKI